MPVNSHPCAPRTARCRKRVGPRRATCGRQKKPFPIAFLLLAHDDFDVLEEFLQVFLVLDLLREDCQEDVVRDRI